MTIEVSNNLVEHIATLARISLSSEEKAELREHFEKVLRFVERLDELDTAEVDPSIFALEAQNVTEADEPHEPLGVEGALANSPASGDDAFIVPRIISDTERGES